MKQLLLLRHADTEDHSPSGTDKDRPLTAQGLEQVMRLREYLDKNDLMPELITSSDARRTQQTVKALDFSGIETRFDSGLYHATAMRLFDEVFAADNIFNRLMVVAHNPGIYEFARMFAGEKDQDFYHGYPTCGLTLFQWDVTNWQDISEPGTDYLGLITV